MTSKLLLFATLALGDQLPSSAPVLVGSGDGVVIPEIDIWVVQVPLDAEGDPDGPMAYCAAQRHGHQGQRSRAELSTLNLDYAYYACVRPNLEGLYNSSSATVPHQFDGLAVVWWVKSGEKGAEVAWTPVYRYEQRDALPRAIVPVPLRPREIRSKQLMGEALPDKGLGALVVSLEADGGHKRSETFLFQYEVTSDSEATDKDYHKDAQSDTEGPPRRKRRSQ